MRFNLIISIVALLCFSNTIQSQEKKSLNIHRTENSPKIDGVLDDDVWKNAEIASDFTQFKPEMGVVSKDHQKTIVKMAYDDKAIYVSAYLKDKPEDIQKQLTSRDNFGQSDFFGIILNPNNDAQNDTEFFVFSSGTQADATATPSNGEDFGWSAVWDSAVKIVDDGWIVEMEIPYRALRFSNDNIQTWGIQFHRRFRLDNSQYSWNPIDRTKGNSSLYHGELTGIKNIEPPTRLSLYPFVTGISNTYDGETDTDLKIGLDVKYGVTENFTLDATLIPDFSQAAFDDLSLNLGPFEQTFGEQRQFFKEGVDLFSKGDLFFSRRVGGGPSGSINLEDNEEIINYPEEIKVLNAVKFSGRTKKGLGIGFFNAITEKTDVTIKSTEDVLNPDTQVIETIVTSRKETIEPLSNYNILVVDQQFNGNSSVSVINTNVTRNGQFRDANVSGLLADISNKKNTYNILGEVKMSNVNKPEKDNLETGLSTFFMVRKIHGKFRYSFDHSLANTRYDINDLGLIYRNNYSNFGVDASYQIFEPTKKLNNFSINTWVNYRRLYKPDTFTGTNFGFNMNAQTKKLMWFGASINVEPGKQYDYFEPRDFENKRYFIYKNIGNIEGWFETNENKTLSLEFFAYAFHAFDSERDLAGYGFGIEPSVRFNDKFRLNYDFTLRNNNGSRGYVNKIDNQIIFGERNIFSAENSISGNYTFNPMHSLALTFRNFWTTVNYDNKLFVLNDNGTLSTEDGYTVADVDNPNVNFNTWNLDLSYTWQIAPGSFVTGLYRNQLFNRDNNAEDDYFESINTLFKEPIQHTFSLRLQYFLDYNNLKSVFSKNKSTS
ncbi:carbohydrate binding family 9 domain-containing protein [Winogradskyella litoriviva]|uniref:Carbohydrate binding family 9 domain-containing protein n=2 Tax=Winogradskyella litoriviva TaxID=1220182 RepID=A0ABX2E4U7_9FLAO|nr:carbohydrate binding family 9 domain-containing protein [Winogradskyella litoriviva]